MKFSEIANRLTGISTPLGGASWEPAELEIGAARRLVAFLEDRRVLYDPGQLEVPSHCVQSVLEIRRCLSEELGIPGVKPSPMPEAMPGVAPLFIQGEGFDSTLVMVNDASVNVGATLTFHDLDGHQFLQRKIVLEKSSRLSLGLSSLFQEIQNAPLTGSLTVMQDMKVTGMVVAAQLTIQDERNSTPAYIDEELGMPAMNGSSTLRGVADPAEGPAFLAITNLASSAQHVALRCVGEKRDTSSVSITIAAYATSVSSGCSGQKTDSVADYIAGLNESKQRGVQGFEIVGDGMPGMLAAFALAPHQHHEAIVFSAVPFVDPMSLMSKNTVYAGVPFGTQSVLSDGIYVPRVALTNFSTQPAHITIETSSSRPQEPEDGTETTDTITPKTLHVLLRPGESKDVLLDADSGSRGLQHSVVVKSDRLPGEVQSKLVSRSDGALYEVEMLAKDEKTTQNGGGHPWLTRDGTESHLLLFNHSARVKTVAVAIANGLTTWKKLYRIAPFDTRQLSIDQIIREQVKDDKGKTLDPKYQGGVVLWSTANPGDITGRLLVSNRASAMAHNFSCGNTVVICGLNLSVFDGGSIPLDYYQEYGSATPNYCWAWGPGQCGNSYQDNGGGGAAFFWNLGNTNIVKFNSPGDQNSSSPNFKGVATGSTYASVNASENGCQSGGSGSPPPAVKVPDHISVNTDNTNAYLCTYGTSRTRTVNYNVIANDGTVYSNPLSLLETVDPSTKTSCNGAVIMTSYSCTPQSTGNYTDKFNPGCATNNTLAQGCGFTFPSQVWEWCQPIGVPVPIGDVGQDIVKNISISLDGNTEGFTKGTTFPK